MSINQYYELDLEQEPAIELQTEEDESYPLQVNEAVQVFVNQKIHYDTTENWNAQGHLIGEEGNLYIYSDYETIYDEVGNPTYVPGIKIGDGNAYLSDLPFISAAMTATIMSHISNDTIHITDAERAFWNNKVSSFLDPQESEKLILSKTNYEINGEII